MIYVITNLRGGTAARYRTVTRRLFHAACWLISSIHRQFVTSADFSLGRTETSGMDPGTIIAVIVTSAQVLNLLTKYYHGVHDARRDVERLVSETQSFRDVLQKIQQLLNTSDGTRLSASSSQVTAITASISSLEKLKDKLDPSHGKRIMKRVGLRALKWPLTKKEVDDCIEHLERCKSTLNLALGVDHT